MAAHGGYLRGPWWRYRSDDEMKTRRCFVIAWGGIIKQPTDKMSHDMRHVQFVIKTGRGAGREEKHLVCVAYGETIASVIMRAMEKGDVVLVCGTWVEMRYKNKKGNAMRYECRVGFIIPMGLIHFLLDLYATDGIQKLIDEYQNAEADVWESDDWVGQDHDISDDLRDEEW